jgi:hypothetical protein
MYVYIYIFVERERDPNNSQHIAWTDLESRSIWCTRYGGTREWPTSNKPFSGNFGQVIPRHTFLIVFSIYNSLFLYVFLDVYIYIIKLYYYDICFIKFHHISHMFHQISSYFPWFPYVSPFFISFPETCPVQKCPRHQVQSSPAARSRRACGFRRRRPEADFQRSILQRMLGQRPQTCRRPWGDGWWNETNILKEYMYLILLYIYIICIPYTYYILYVIYYILYIISILRIIYMYVM